jgi:hypothetical protein
MQLIRFLALTVAAGLELFKPKSKETNHLQVNFMEISKIRLAPIYLCRFLSFSLSLQVESSQLELVSSQLKCLINSEDGETPSVKFGVWIHIYSNSIKKSFDRKL